MSETLQAFLTFLVACLAASRTAESIWQRECLCSGQCDVVGEMVSQSGRQGGQPAAGEGNKSTLGNVRSSVSQ
jgi:hypothetical protein